MNSNAGNIGFAASVDTGMSGIKVNVQCEQFTFYNQFADSTASTWCNRNSKIGLSHPMMGEIMFATWLLPYNEGVAQWVDPFYDAGADPHTNIMGSVGAGGGSSTFYNPVFGRTNGFNRRQENIIQYWSPNWNGFVFRFAWILGHRDETEAPRGGGGEIDPVIRSSSLAYTNGPAWLAVTWQEHEDWAAASAGEMNGSDAESFRLAGRYIMDMGNGMSIQVSTMWEDLEYEFSDVSSIDGVMDAFGYGSFDTSYGLLDESGDIIMPADRGGVGENGNVAIERDAWMVSGKVKFGGPLDLRFSYADADDLEVSCAACSGDWNESGGDAWNIGLFYTMPAGTELRLTYSEVNSDDNVGYGQSIPGTGVGTPGNEIEMFALGIVHWFD